MTEKYPFTAKIEAEDESGGAFVTIPFDVEKTFGKKRVKIKATIDGEPYRGSLVRMGSSHHMLIILKEIRQKIGKTSGDEVTIELEEDLDPRIVEVPADLQQALQSVPGALSIFNQLSYSHQREYVNWIDDAKHAETRTKRINRVIDVLIQGKK